MTALGILIVGSALWMYFESRGFAYRKQDVGGMAAMSPLGWFFCCLFLWFIAFPVYLASRGKLRAAGLELRAKAATDERILVKPQSNGQPIFVALIAALMMLGFAQSKDARDVAVASSPPEASRMELTAAAPAAIAPAAQPVAPAAHVRGPMGIKLSSLRSYLRKCAGGVGHDVVHGEARVMCHRKGAVPTLFEAIGPEDNLTSITFMVGVPENEIGESMMKQFTFLQDVTGRKLGDIAPDGWLEKLAEGEQSFVYNGLKVESEALTTLGMMRYSITRAE